MLEKVCMKWYLTAQGVCWRRCACSDTYQHTLAQGVCWRWYSGIQATTLISTDSMLEMISRYPGCHTYQHSEYVGEGVYAVIFNSTESMLEKVCMQWYSTAQKACWRKCVCSDIQQHREHVGEGVYVGILNSTGSVVEKASLYLGTRLSYIPAPKVSR